MISKYTETKHFCSQLTVWKKVAVRRKGSKNNLKDLVCDVKANTDKPNMAF